MSKLKGTQLPISDVLPKSRGGARPGSGRPRSRFKTVTIRVAAGVAERCKAIDSHYRKLAIKHNRTERFDRLD